jgi:hypothetical protein
MQREKRNLPKSHDNCQQKTTTKFNAKKDTKDIYIYNLTDKTYKIN